MTDLLPFEWPVYAVKMKGSEDLYFFDPSLGNRYNTGDGWLVLLRWGEERKFRPFGPDNRVIRDPEEVEWMEQLNATRPSAALTDEERMAWECQSGTGCGLWRENKDCGHGSVLAACVRRLSTRPAAQDLREAEAWTEDEVKTADCLLWILEKGDVSFHPRYAKLVRRLFPTSLWSKVKALAALQPQEQKR